MTQVVGGCNILLMLDLIFMQRIVDCGDYVVVTNTRKVHVTGRKENQKLYRTHSMYPGGLKERKYKDVMAHKPDEVRYRTYGLLFLTDLPFEL